MPPTRRDAAATRAAILTAAREHFRRDGFAATTTRAVAGAAGVDAALVSRYFGSKQGLWDAALVIDLDLPDLSRVDRADLGLHLATAFVERWEGDQGSALRLALAAAPNHPDAAATVRGVLEAQVRPALGATAPDDGGAADDRVQLVVALLLGTATCRYVLELPGFVDRTAEEVVRLLAPALQQHLGAGRRPPSPD